MNTRTTLCIVAAIVSIILNPAAAHARLGETLAQCEARYGKAKIIEGTHFFQKAPMVIGCKFVNGTCESIGIFHSESDRLGQPLEMTQVEIEALLEANSKGSTWVKREVMSVDKIWQTSDGLIQARYYTFRKELNIMTTAELERLTEEKAAKEKAKLKGF